MKRSEVVKAMAAEWQNICGQHHWGRANRPTVEELMNLFLGYLENGLKMQPPERRISSRCLYGCHGGGQDTVLKGWEPEESSVQNPAMRPEGQ